MSWRTASNNGVSVIDRNNDGEGIDAALSQMREFTNAAGNFRGELVVSHDKVVKEANDYLLQFEKGAARSGYDNFEIDPLFMQHMRANLDPESDAFVVYVFMSYDAPIAWYRIEKDADGNIGKGLIWITDKKYSPTTNKHRKILERLYPYQDDDIDDLEA